MISLLFWVAAVLCGFASVSHLALDKNRGGRHVFAVLLNLFITALLVLGALGVR